MASVSELAPGLLIAMPQLADPNFRRSVVLMTEHHPEGSFGLAINRPAQHRVAEVLASLDVTWGGAADASVWVGGPVQQETGWILHEPVAGLQEPGTREIAPGIQLSSAPEALAVLAVSPPSRMRFILGYSGWGPGQLENELTQGSWVTSDLTPELVFDTHFEELWETAVRRLGIAPEALAPASGVH
ncbi:MAG: YqgE/AlgH family protein [Candidatus Binatia bacterium]